MSTIDDIRDGLSGIDDEVQRRREAYENAYGVGWDDANEPSIVAEVERGQLSSLTIHDSVADQDPELVAVLANAVIGEAYAGYSADLQRLLD
jgi:hypothetical protein